MPAECLYGQLEGPSGKPEAGPWGPVLAPAQPARNGRGQSGHVCAAGRLCVQAAAQTKHTHQAVIYQLWEAQEALKPQVGARKATLLEEHRPQALLRC